MSKKQKVGKGDARLFLDDARIFFFFLVIQQFLAIEWFPLSLLDYVMGFLRLLMIQ